MTLLGATLYYLGCSVLACTLLAWLMYRTNRLELRRLVWQNLDSADSGGQFNCASSAQGVGYLHGMTAAEVANDMSIYCEDLAGVYDEDELYPHVQTWMASRGIAA